MITIVAFFTDNGVPKTGLTPIVSIREVATGADAIPSATSNIMVELGDGLYKYEFDGDDDLDYAFVCDGGASLTSADRYVYGGTELREVHNKLEFIKQVESGRWKLDSSTNQMIFYEDDNSTEIMRFNLFDLAGSPTVDGVSERRRV